MGRTLSFGKVFESLCCLSNDPNSCFCINSFEATDDDEELQLERKPLVVISGRENQISKLQDVVYGKQTLALLLKPKTVVLKVSMHCYGCAKKVEKHISKIEGVTSYKVDLETKMVVVIGDVLPFEVLQSVSKVKNAQIWTAGI